MKKSVVLAKTNRLEVFGNEESVGERGGQGASPSQREGFQLNIVDAALLKCSSVSSKSRMDVRISLRQDDLKE